MYAEDTKITDLTVKELREVIKTEVALLMPNKNFYDYSKVYVTTRTKGTNNPIYPDPSQAPYC